MCGIVGYFGDRPIDLQRSLAQLAHRGPDLQASQSGPGFGLGHTLLSIIGIEPIKQPMPSSDGRLTLAFNGEIYNYIELRAADQELRKVTSGLSDTEVLTEGLSLHGLDFVEQLNGMFAISAFDHANGTGFLVRDRLGIKPLYYSIRGGTILFSSEMRALHTMLQELGVPAEPDPEGFYSYARFRYPLGDRSFTRSVKMLEPGSILTWRDGSASIGRYWQIEPQAPLDIPYADAVEETDRIARDAIQLRMRSDHSFCTFLSGGLDSSYLSAVASETKNDLYTYSISIEDERFDESQYSLQVARLLGTRHHTVTLSKEEYRDSFKDSIALAQTPLGVPNQVALWVLSRRLARDHRCVLSGEGADEVFGGYGRIFLLPIDWDILELTRAGNHPRLEAEFTRRYGSTQFADYASLFLARYAYLSHDEASGILRTYFEQQQLDQARESVESDIRQRFMRYAETETDIFTRQLLFFQEIHLPGLLLRLDAASMAHSVEARVPFLDHRLVEFVNSLSPEVKMRRLQTFRAAARHGAFADELSETHDVPKAVLKDAARLVLPSSIVDRTKVGFPIPEDYYLMSNATSKRTSQYAPWVDSNMMLWAASRSEP